MARCLIAATLALAMAVGSKGGLAATSPSAGAVSLSDLNNACILIANGYQAGQAGRLYTSFRHGLGQCGGKARHLRFGVTQENDQNSHRGSRNFDSRIVTYMTDYDYSRDFGKWVDVGFSNGVLSLKLNTTSETKINVTGWPLQFGHLFARVRDTLCAAIDRDIHISFDMRLSASTVGRSAASRYSGRRVVVGARVDWRETPPRSNVAHFVEFDLSQSPGYTANYHETAYPACRDRTYDRCYYDPHGKYSEGREVRAVPELSAGEWTHYDLPLSTLTKSLGWVSAPSDWGEAKVQAIYIGIESVGATNTGFDLRNYHVSVNAADSGCRRPGAGR
jgi:hypothetical protein